MPRLFISRMLETFFRRKWLYLLPLVPFVALGVLTVLNVKPVYRSTGVLLVNKTVVGEAGGPFGNETPAVATSRQITTLLLTEKFFSTVIDEANASSEGAVRANLASGAVTEDSLRFAVSATASGDELVSIGAATANPELSRLLANATMDRFKQSLHENIDDQPAGDPNAAGTTETPSAAEVDARKVEAKRVIQARYVPYDRPKPGTPEPHRQKDVLTLVLFTGLGLLVCTAALVVGTLLDHSMRYSDEIETRLHVPVLGTVPDSRAAIKPMVL